MSSVNGNGRVQWVLNIVLGLLIGVLGYVWRDQVSENKETKREVGAVKIEQAVLKASNDAKWDEVIRRLGRIETKVDREPSVARVGGR